MKVGAMETAQRRIFIDDNRRFGGTQRAAAGDDDIARNRFGCRFRSVGAFDKRDAAVVECKTFVTQISSCGQKENEKSGGDGT